MSSKNSGSVYRMDHLTRSRLLERMSLDNGLTLQMFDNSRHVAGDRWFVSFEARIEVEVKREYFQDWYKRNVPFEDIRTVVGETVLYRHEKVLNFIKETEKEEVFR